MTTKIEALMDTIRQANRAFPAGQVRNGGQAVDVTAGRTLANATQIGLLALPSIKGESVYVRDVAQVIEAPREDQARAWRYARVGQGWSEAPAVSLAIARLNSSLSSFLTSEALARRERGVSRPIFVIA